MATRMLDPLKILLVDQNPQALTALRRSLNDFNDLEVVGDAGFGPVAATWAYTLEPNIILVAVEDPVARALTTIQSLTRGSPAWTVVALVGQFNRDVFRRAVLAGARDVVVRSDSASELREAIVEARRADAHRTVEHIHDPGAPTGSIVTVFGVKGGVGKTTIATNLAVALAAETSASIALVDLDLPFGDIALMLDLRPERDVTNALEESVLGDLERLQGYMVKAPHGVHVMTAPLVPDGAAQPDSTLIGLLLTGLSALYQFVVVDTPPGLTEVTAAALDTSELALLVTTPEVPALRRTQACLRLLQRLDFPDQKTQLVLNRVHSRTRVSESEAVQALGQPIAWRVANDYAAMMGAAFGQPVVLAQPKTQLARDIRGIARQLAGLPPEPKRRSWLPWRRGRATWGAEGRPGRDEAAAAIRAGAL
jgi:pilus assembly protein CpaE